MQKYADLCTRIIYERIFTGPCVSVRYVLIYVLIYQCIIGHFFSCGSLETCMHQMYAEAVFRRLYSDLEAALMHFHSNYN